MISLSAGDTTVDNIGLNAAIEFLNDIQSMRKWFDLSKLIFNTRKCVYICVAGVKLLGREAFGNKVSLGNHYEYIGVTVDGKLAFKDHVGHVT